jgi:hypothetical protein
VVELAHKKSVIAGFREDTVELTYAGTRSTPSTQRRHRLGLSGLCGLCVFLAGAATALAQESKSAPLAKQLAAALEAGKLDSIAAKDPSTADVYFGALYIPGFQLLVVANKYPAPLALDARLSKKEYRDLYIDLNSSGAESRTFIEDLGADGLKAKRDENQPFDSVETKGARTFFDSDWKKQKLSEDDYMKSFAAADERYVQILTALLMQPKKGS